MWGTLFRQKCFSEWMGRIGPCGQRSVQPVPARSTTLTPEVGGGEGRASRRWFLWGTWALSKPQGWSLVSAEGQVPWHLGTRPICISRDISTCTRRLFRGQRMISAQAASKSAFGTASKSAFGSVYCQFAVNMVNSNCSEACITQELQFPDATNA